MHLLDKDITSLPKIGPKYKVLFSNLEISTVKDLLYHFPSRYQDFSVLYKINNLQLGQEVSIRAQLLDVKNIFTKFGKRITKAQIADETGKMDLVWFNQHYIASNMQAGLWYYFSGKVAEFNKKFTIFSAEFEEVKEGTLNTNRLVPIYPETAGLTSKFIRSRINEVLTGSINYEDLLPDELLKKEKLLTFNEAVRKIHFPLTETDISESRRKFQFEELTLELLNVEYRKKFWDQTQKSKALTLGKNSTSIKNLIQSLPFTLTDSQNTALKEILEDLGKKVPMNRMLEGDVGTGKTIVALIAAYLAKLNKMRVLYMAPTEILAKQHYETFIKYLEPLGVKITLKTGSKKSVLENEDFNIAIGTHAILYKNNSEEFVNKNLDNIGLVIIDEQHRFGVEQRAKIIEISKSEKNEKPHLLTMTATPIPRTLALTLYGDLDISVLKTPPNKNKKITTRVIPENMRQKAYEWIKAKKEPAFIVCPLIEESQHESFENVKSAQTEYGNLKNGIFKDVAVGLLHGKMKSKEKNEVIEKFRKNEIHILVATPVIEVGIDIPDATIIVIESAERYGLASLHQLRGRVGRGKKEGFCLVFMSNNSKAGYRRLKNLEEINDGLKLAEIDLQYRGSGDVYGTMQHGFKEFKIADISNLEMLEKCKLTAQDLVKNLEKYPQLFRYIKKNDLIEKN